MIYDDTDVETFEPRQRKHHDRPRRPLNADCKSRSCSTKKRFSTIEEAKAFRYGVINAFRRTGHQYNPLRIYECCFCNGFHFAKENSV